MPPSATGASAPITLNGVVYHLWRERDGKGRIKPAEVDGQFGPGDITQQQTARDVPRIWDDWSGGGGYSRRDPRVPNGYAWCIGDARFPRVFAPAGQLVEIALPGGLGLPAPPYDSFEANGKVFILAGSQAIGISQATGLTTGIEQAFPVTSEATSAVRYGGNVYVGLSAGLMWRYAIATNTWTQAATAMRDWMDTVYWVVAGLGADRIVGAVAGTNQIKVFPSNPAAPGDPMNDADWSAAYPVGTSDRIIRNLAASKDHVYIVKTDGIYDMDARGWTPNLTSYWGQQFSPASGLSSIVHQSYVYATHVYGLDRVQIGSSPNRDRPEWCQPGVGQSAEGPVFGTVRGLGVDGPWLVGLQFNGTETYVCYGQSRDQPGVPNGPGPILWHTALAKIPHMVGTFAKIHEVNGLPWLFIGGVDYLDSITPRLYRMAVPRAANPMQALLWPGSYGPTSLPFATTASLTLPVDDWGDATAFKVLRRFDIQAENLDEQMGMTYLELLANADGAAFESQGQVVATRETLIPSENVATGYQIGTRVDLTGTITAPALLRALKARAGVSIDATETRVYRIALGQMTEGYNRGRDRRDPEVLFAQLWGLQGAGPVEMRDHRGRDLTVKVESVAQKDVEVPGMAGRRWEMVAVVSMSILQRPGYWDVSTWTSDATWSA